MQGSGTGLALSSNILRHREKVLLIHFLQTDILFPLNQAGGQEWIANELKVKDRHGSVPLNLKGMLSGSCIGWQPTPTRLVWAVGNIFLHLHHGQMLLNLVTKAVRHSHDSIPKGK